MTTEKSMAIRDEPNEGLAYLPPKLVVARASEQAEALMGIVEKQHLYMRTGDKKYLEAEAWATILAFNQVHIETESIEEVWRDGQLIAYRAKVRLVHDVTGQVKGSAIMDCGLDEFPCRGKQGHAKDRACISSAETWAMSKAARLNYSWVAVLAGYEPTPADEMQRDPAPPLTSSKPVAKPKELYSPTTSPPPPANSDAVDIGYQEFWAFAREAGKGASEVANALNAVSLTEWLKLGKLDEPRTLRQAQKICETAWAKETAKPAAPTVPASGAAKRA